MPSQLCVLHVYKSFPPVRGGIEGHIDLLTRLLHERGVASEVLCAAIPGVPRRENRNGVRVQRCASVATVASTPLPPLLPWAVRRNPADVIHLHYPWPPGEVAWLFGGRRRPLVVTVHCEPVRQARLVRALGPLTRRVLAAAGRIVVDSAAMRTMPLLAAYRDRVQVIPLGVDLDHFRPNPAAADPLPRLARPRIIFVGRLRHYKGLPVLAAALALLPGAQLVVAGDGPERATLKRALRTHGCDGRAHLLGDVDDDRLLAILQTADAAVLASTSRAEAFGIAIAEAQACGVPAVTTDVGTGTGQTLADGCSGRIVPPNDPGTLASALAWCLDPTQAPARRAAARAHAEAHLSARRMAEETHRVYAELLRTSRHAG